MNKFAKANTKQFINWQK